MNPMIVKLGLTLVHSLWEGALIWAGLRLLLAALRFSSANLRYLVACGALAFAAAAPCVTFLRLATTKADSEPGAFGPGEAGRVDGTVQAVAGSGVDGSSHSRADRPDYHHGWLAQLGEATDAIAPWLVAAWAFGCAFSATRFAVAWRAARRLAGTPLRPIGEGWERLCRELALRLGIARAVRIGESGLVAVPSVVGWIKPVILVPVGAFCGLSVPEAEGILAHELAHVVRNDFAVNLFQSMCEVLFFYSPAILAINRSIRAEREDACDDIAVRLTGDARCYAAVLARLEERRGGALALAASGNGGALLPRIRRILRPRKDSLARTVAPVWAVGFSAVIYLIVLISVPTLATRADDAPPPVPAKDGGQAAVQSAGIEPYRILTNDVIRVVVYQRAELSASARCDAAGYITLPAVGVLKVLGMTLGEATGKLREAYADRIGIRNPNVTLSIAELAPREVSVAGNVRNPGRYPLPIETVVTPVDLVLTAGGLTPDADGSAVRITHVFPDGTVYSATANVESVIQGRVTDSVMVRSATAPLHPGDIVFVPAAGSLPQAPPTSTEWVEAEVANLPHELVPYAVDPGFGFDPPGGGDRIEIQRIRSDRTKFEVGGTYLVEGTYTLASEPNAHLAFNLTTHRPVSTPVNQHQSIRIERGSGTFSLLARMSEEGEYHVSFYVGGHPIGGVYFAGSTAMKAEVHVGEPKVRNYLDSGPVK